MTVGGKNIARVFPRRNNATPNDQDAFIGPFPRDKDKRRSIADRGYDEVHVSVTFTWDRPKAEKLVKSWAALGIPVKIGGPAYGDRFSGSFTPGLYIKHGYTFSSRGCPKSCWFCSVYAACHGKIKLLPIQDGHKLCDDNILATSPEHFKAVMTMLARQPQKAVFAGGIEPSFLQPWQAEEMHKIKPARIYCAYDTPDDLEPLIEAGKIFRTAGFTTASHVLACYVLIGWQGDTFAAAEKRLEQTIDAGFMPFAMLYRDADGKRDPAWRQFQREWASPYIVGAKMRDRKE